MVYSMTGYGQATGVFQYKKIKVELKSLNSKSSDVKVRANPLYRSQEIAIRNLILKELKRGKVEVSIEVISEGADDEYRLNTALFKNYYHELNKLQEELNISPNSDYINGILRIPNVVSSQVNDLSKEEWECLQQILIDACTQVMVFREEEGRALQADIANNIKNIRHFLKSISPFEEARIQKIKERILNSLQKQVEIDTIDTNRLEQELIYYLEKLDINEEKVRLEQHCQFLQTELEDKKYLKGRKLNFIAQEIGREINTIGSKAASSDIQHFVVEMKDCLEKIKEQTANIL